MSDISSIYENTVPISLFDSGFAEEIFEDVNQSGIKVVVKDNTAECILLSPDEYVRLMNELDDARLYVTAMERMEQYDPRATISHDELKRELGITQENLDRCVEVEFE